MRKYYIMFVALVLLIVDIPIPTFLYPAFEEFRTEAPVTVSLVIDHVVGHRLRMDVFSDLIGYLLLLISAAQLSPEDKRFRRCFIWGALSMAVLVYWQAMPFYLNGGVRFRAGYMLYFLAALLKIVTVFLAMYTVAGQLENTSNHSYNNVTVILMMLCAACGVVSALMWFFDLIVIVCIYDVVQLILFGVVTWRIWNDRSLLMEGVQHA